MEYEITGELSIWLAEEHARLPRSWYLSRRYIPRDVDTFVRDVGTMLERGELPEPSLIRSAQFRVTTDLRLGFRLREVDDLLDELVVRVTIARLGIDPASRSAVMIAHAERVRFGTTWRGGYDFGDVGAFMIQVRETLAAGGQPSAPPTFTLRRRGFVQQDVDTFLDELRDYAL